MKRLIVIGMMLMMFLGCATVKVIDEPTDKITLEGIKNGMEWRRTGHIWCLYLGQVKGKYHVFDYKLELTPEVRNRLNITNPSIKALLMDLPTGKWIVGKLHIRCDGFLRFYTGIIKDMNGAVLYEAIPDKWIKSNPIIDKICRDAGICRWID